MDQDIILEEEVQVHGSQKPADEAKEGEVLHKPASCFDNPASPSIPPTSSADHTIIDDHAITKEDSKAITEQETIFDMNPFKPTPPDEAAEILHLWTDSALTVVIFINNLWISDLKYFFLQYIESSNKQYVALI